MQINYGGLGGRGSLEQSLAGVVASMVATGCSELLGLETTPSGAIVQAGEPEHATGSGTYAAWVKATPMQFC